LDLWRRFGREIWKLASSEVVRFVLWRGSEVSQAMASFNATPRPFLICKKASLDCGARKREGPRLVVILWI
jgi:hypothetical protein